MSDQDKVASTVFATFEFLQQLNTEEQKSFLSQVKIISLDQGQFICLEGDDCQHLPLIISGQVRVYKIGESGREITLYRLRKGDSCIMTASCIVSQNIFPALAVTETDVEAIIIPASSLQNWLTNNSVWQKYIFGLLSQRLANVIEIVEEVAFRRMDCRIATYLLKMNHLNYENCTIKITHEAIAQDLGTSREVVSRILKTFEQKELLLLARGTIQLKNMDGLFKIIEFERF